MNTLQILLVEDNLTYALEVEMLLSEMGYQIAATLDNGDEALHFILDNQPDLILMDIHLKGSRTGLDIAKEIQHLKIPIIFTTVSTDKQDFEDAHKAYSFGYLVKPFNKLTLQSAIERTIKALFPENELNEEDVWREDEFFRNCFLIKAHNVLHKVSVEDINFIHGEGNYCTLHAKGKKYVVKISLKKMLDLLDRERFLPVHKSYMVQLDKVDSIDVVTNKIHVGQEVIPLGRNFKPKLLGKFRLLK